MFTPKSLPKKNHLLKIFDHKQVKQLGKEDRETFLSEYFSNIQLFIRVVIGNEDEHDYFFNGKEIREQIYPFLKALYRVTDYSVIEKGFLETYNQVLDWLRNRAKSSEFTTGNLYNFLYRLNLIINHFYPNENNPIFKLELELGKRALDASRSEFRALEALVQNPLAHIIKLETRRLREEVQLYLLRYRYPDAFTDFDHSTAQFKLEKWMADYPRTDILEIITKAIEKWPSNSTSKEDKEQMAKVIPILITIFNKLKEAEIDNQSSPKLRKK